MTTLTPTWLWARCNQNFWHFFWNKQIIIYLQRFHLEKWRYGQSSRNCRQSWKNRKTLWSWWSSRGIWWISSASILFEDRWGSKLVLGSSWWSLWCNSLIVIILSGDYYGAFVLLLFETQDLWFLCLLCISTFQVGYDNLVQSGREFVREGCLQKLSRKGYQQRMFFLVSFNIIHFFFLFFFLVSFLSSTILWYIR